MFARSEPMTSRMVRSPTSMVDDRTGRCPGSSSAPSWTLKSQAFAIGDPVLDDPLDVHDVQVAGEHRRFLRIFLGRIDGLEARTVRAVPELLYLHDLGPHVVVPLDSEGYLPMKTRFGRHGCTARRWSTPRAPSCPPRKSSCPGTPPRLRPRQRPRPFAGS
ncbi:MAG: hypothetical protein MZU97_12395 [Bacillus subtilis]|nr:hypothetical protein [Bacillus subtilis]